MLRAAIFDLDGLLVDSEPLWRRAERACFGEVGLELTDEDCRATTGLGIEQVARYWFERRPWPGPDPVEVAGRILERVTAMVRDQGEAMPGAIEAVAAARRAGLRLALASGSSMELVRTAVRRLGLEGAFEVVCSAQDETHGKPHPAVYLTAAERLGLAPTGCVAIEDSLNGVVAAKAARMACIAVPDPAVARPERFAVADLVLGSLRELDEGTFARLEARAEGR